MSYGGQMQYPGPAPGMGAPPVRAPQPPPTQTSIQFMLDENCQLIQSIIDHHQQGTHPTFSREEILFFIKQIEFFGPWKTTKNRLILTSCTPNLCQFITRFSVVCKLVYHQLTQIRCVGYY